MRTTNKKALIAFIMIMALIFIGASVYLIVRFKEYIFTNNTLAIIVFSLIGGAVIGAFVWSYYLFNRQR